MFTKDCAYGTVLMGIFTAGNAEASKITKGIRKLIFPRFRRFGNMVLTPVHFLRPVGIHCVYAVHITSAPFTFPDLFLVPSLS